MYLLCFNSYMPVAVGNRVFLGSSAVVIEIGQDVDLFLDLDLMVFW